LKHHVFAALLWLACLPAYLLAQETGEIGGAVTSKATGEPLVGIAVAVEGTTLGAATDIDGKYVIKRVPAGTATLRITGVGYASKTVTGVEIIGAKTTTLDIGLDEESVNLQEVVVTAEEVRSAENAVLAQRKRSASISDGVSAEQIKRSPDVTSSDALKRVTGISIVDNKFVFVRGITDRYNQTTLDGAPVTSTEAGKKSFSFDLLPANLIENTSVIKSATPDLPGDFSGGLVQLNTRDFPNENTYAVTLGTSSNSITTQKDFLRAQGGSKDWLGFDDGRRSYPGDHPDPNQTARNLPNSWAPLTRTAPYNSELALSFGQKIDLSTEGSTPAVLGLTGAISYRNTLQKFERTNDDYVLNLFSTGTQNEYDVLWGAIANAGLKFGLNKISFKNSFNQSGHDVVKDALIEDNNIPVEDKYVSIRWTQRSSYTGQLTGEHDIPSLLGLNLQWRASVSSSKREDPDWKEGIFYRDPTDPTQPYYPNATNYRSWAALNDRSHAFATDATLPVASIKLKTGGFTESRTTGYEIRYFELIPSQYPHSIPDSIALLPLETIYDPSHFGPGLFDFRESTHPEDAYDGDSKLYAGYLMADAPFELYASRFRFVGGARIENFEQNVYVTRTGGSMIPSHHIYNDVLPSMNLAYLFNDVTNFRLAYSQSVNRADFRELASTEYYDYVIKQSIKGNPDLRRSLIRNYDARLEVFPGAGELLALSYFYKNLTDPIEENLEGNSSGYVRTWKNSPTAKNYGWEVEARKSLAFLGGFGRDFSFMANYTRVQSQVDYTRGGVTYTRPLQGQSPYVINLSLAFTEPSIGTSLSLLYNKFGSRIYTVGSGATDAGDIYEQPRDAVDFALTQQLSTGLEAKFTIRNLADKDRVMTRGDKPYEELTIGRTFGLHFSLNM
jgi:hypothetical protein